MTRTLRKPNAPPVLLYLFLTALPAQGQLHYHDNGAPWKHTAEMGPDLARARVGLLGGRGAGGISSNNFDTVFADRL